MLTDLQKSVISYIAHEALAIRAEYERRDEVDVRVDRMIVAGAYAFALYTDLTKMGVICQHRLATSETSRFRGSQTSHLVARRNRASREPVARRPTFPCFM